MSMEQTCPRCGNMAGNLQSVNIGTRLALNTVPAPGDDNEDIIDSAPQADELVCPKCFEELQGKVSQGAMLRAELVAKEKNRQLLWKSRIELVKQGRMFMREKAFPEAAVYFEKYIRVVEIAHSLKAGELTPELFSKSSHSKELTVIAATYWDLFRIYDCSQLYKERMSHSGQKLMEFLPYSPLSSEIQKKADVFARKAKNTAIAKSLSKKLKGSIKSCFIATSAFEGPEAPEVCYLRHFRDNYLNASIFGSLCVRIYYRFSPSVASHLDQHNYLKPMTRSILRLFILGIKLSLKCYQDIPNMNFLSFVKIGPAHHLNRPARTHIAAVKEGSNQCAHKNY